MAKHGDKEDPIKALGFDPGKILASDWAIEAADRILDLDAIEMKFDGWNKDGTRKRIASIIAAYAEPLLTGPGTPAARLDWFAAELGKRWNDPEPMSARAFEPRFLAWLDALVALLRESKRDGHGTDDDGDPCEKVNYLDGLHACTCGSDAWNAKVDEALAGDGIGEQAKEP